MASNPEMRQEALTRAQSGESGANYRVILEGFTAKGIRAEEIRPRENVFTYNAWQALGRQVRKGEKGVRCLTFIDAKDKATGQTKRRPWHTSVFHVSQTDAMNTSPYNTANNYAGPRQLPAPKPHSFTPAVTLSAGHNLAVDAIDIEHDATGENVEHAGETEPASWDAAELARQRVEARRVARARVVANSLGKQADGDTRTAYERVQAGEAVSILDIMRDAGKRESKPARKDINF